MLLAGLLLASPASAQRSADDPGIERLAEAIRAGDRARAAGDWENAITAYRRAEGLLGMALLYGPEDRFLVEEGAAIRRGLAEAYLQSGDPYAAVVEAARGANQLEDDSDLWSLLGLARYRLADVPGAAEALDRAAALGADDARLHRGLALVAAARNRLEEARRHGATVLSRADDPRMARAMADWAAAAGEYGAAADALERYAGENETHDPRIDGLAGFYRTLATAPAVRIDPRVTRIQANFDLVTGDEIPYVPVRFNGAAPAYVLFDTGAERNVIDRAFARSVGVDERWAGPDVEGPFRVSSRGGYAIVDSLALGGVNIGRVPFAVADFGALRLREQGAYYIAAVINPALVFRDFLVVLDYGHRRIELVRYDAGGGAYLERRTRLRRTTTPFWFDANGVWPVVSVRLDGSQPVPLLADTGASDVLLDRKVAGALRLDPNRFEAAVEGHFAPALRAQLLDEPPGDRWGMELGGVLGYPFFRGHRVVFDYRSMQLILED